MMKTQQNCNFSNQQSQYDQDGGKEIKNQQIRQLLKSKTQFSLFINNLGENSKIPLSPANLRYSKQILQGQFDGEQIYNLVKNRVDKMIKNNKIKKNWCKEDCTILAWILEKTTNGRHIRAPEKLKQSYWQTAARLIPGTTSQQCMFKWLCMKKNKLGNNKWSSTQSKILQKIVKQHGTQDWKKISRELFRLNHSQDKKYRHPKQCRQQWNCYLNPTLKKGPWSKQEDLNLLQSVQKYGRRWSFICKSMIGRTQNALKNRFSFLIQHQKQKNLLLTQQQIFSILLKQLKQAKQKINEQIEISQFKQQPKIALMQQKLIQIPKIESKQQLTKIQQNSPQHVTIVECNYEQLTNFLRMNQILIPAKISKNQLVSYEGQVEKSFKIKF